MRKIHGYVIKCTYEFINGFGDTVPVDTLFWNKKFYETERNVEEALTQLRINYPSYTLNKAEMFEK